MQQRNQALLVKCSNTRRACPGEACPQAGGAEVLQRTRSQGAGQKCLKFLDVRITGDRAAVLEVPYYVLCRHTLVHRRRQILHSVPGAEICVPAARPRWARLRAAGRGRWPVPQPQGGPACQLSGGLWAAEGTPPAARRGVRMASGGAGDSQVEEALVGVSQETGGLYFLYSHLCRHALALHFAEWLPS
jgi:hypothetical protein